MAAAKQGPPLNIPKSSSCCHVSIINTTCDISVPPAVLVEPEIPGFNWMNLPTFSFYIKHESSGRELLFDLGARKDWDNSVPAIAGLVRDHVPGIWIKDDVLDIVARGNVDVSKIEALVLSHWHFDHCGAPSKMAKNTKMIVGPGFKEAFLPGYPTKQESPFHEADFEGREVQELTFSDGLKIGKFQAHDYFGDGSFFILNVPGHAIGHISAIARTTPDTFAFLGGDVCHFTGDIRPSEYMPMPDPIPEEAVLDKKITRPCPCSAFLSSHPLGEEKGKTVSDTAQNKTSRASIGSKLTITAPILTTFIGGKQLLPRSSNRFAIRWVFDRIRCRP